MRSFITLLLLVLTTCNFINEREVQYLKENAPYEVYDVNENPFKDWSEDEIRGLFGVVLNEVNEEEKEKGKVIRQERFYGEMSRSFYVGDNIDENSINASFENGILKLVVPKKEIKDNKKLIEIK